MVDELVWGMDIATRYKAHPQIGLYIVAGIPPQILSFIYVVSNYEVYDAV